MHYLASTPSNSYLQTNFVLNHSNKGHTPDELNVIQWFLLINWKVGIAQAETSHCHWRASCKLTPKSWFANKKLLNKIQNHVVISYIKFSALMSRLFSRGICITKRLFMTITATQIVNSRFVYKHPKNLELVEKTMQSD